MTKFFITSAAAPLSFISEYTVCTRSVPFPCTYPSLLRLHFSTVSFFSCLKNVFPRLLILPSCLSIPSCAPPHSYYFSISLFPPFSTLYHSSLCFCLKDYLCSHWVEGFGTGSLSASRFRGPCMGG